MSNPLIVRKVVRDVPVYEFYHNNRKAVDEYLEIADAHMELFIAQGNAHRPFCYVLDISRSGMYPVNYLLQRSKVLLSKYKVSPEHYIAYVSDNPNDAVLVNMIDGLTARNMEHKRRVFSVERFDEAIAWLQDVMRDAD